MRSLRVPGGARASPGCSFKGVATKTIYYFLEISLRELPGPPRDPLFLIVPKFVVFVLLIVCSLLSPFWGSLWALFGDKNVVNILTPFLSRFWSDVDLNLSTFHDRFADHSRVRYKTRALNKNIVKPQLILLLLLPKFLDFWRLCFLCAFLCAVCLHRFLNHFWSLLEHFWGHFWCTFGVWNRVCFSIVFWSTLSSKRGLRALKPDLARERKAHQWISWDCDVLKLDKLNVYGSTHDLIWTSLLLCCAALC